jgi:hypothetical protein
MIAAKRGLFLSVMMPIGIPDAYMPRLAAVPWKGESIAVEGATVGIQ